MKTAVIFILLYFLASQPAYAQKKYSLEECFALAKTNNYSIRQSRNEIAKTYIDKKAAVYSLTPSIAFNGAHLFSSGKSIDPVTNNFVNDNFSGGSISMDAILGIFSGMQKLNNIKQADYSIKAAEATTTKIELEVMMAIISAYSNALYWSEHVALLKNNTLRTEKELAIAEEKIDVGKISKSEYYTINARLKNEFSGIIDAQNDSANAMLQLAQLIATSLKDSFLLDSLSEKYILKMMQAEVIAEELLSVLLKNHPLITEAFFTEKAAEKGLRAAKGARMPLLSLEGSLISNYNISYTDPAGSKIPVQKQLDNNLGRYAGIVLEVPLFQQSKARFAIEKEKIALQNAGIAIEAAQMRLTASVRHLTNNLYAAQRKYKMQAQALEQGKRSYAVYEEKHKLGMISSLELVSAKDYLYEVQSKLLEARYQLFIAYNSVQILDRL